MNLIAVLTPSADSKKVLGQALQSEILVGWDAPSGCGTACNYTIQYSAPALLCAELAIDEANTMLPVSGETGDRTVYNATTLNSVEGYLQPISIAWRTYDTNGKSTVAGTRCSFYNTTQQSVVSFVNNTGMIFPSIISYDNPVNMVVIDCPEPVEGTSVSFIHLCSGWTMALWAALWSPRTPNGRELRERRPLPS